MIEHVQNNFEKAYPDLHRRFYHEVFALGHPLPETQIEWQQALADFINE